MQVRLLHWEQILNNKVMSKIITTSMALRKSSSFFNDKSVKLLVRQRSISGDTIEANIPIKIKSRSHGTKSAFNIKDENTGIQIDNVWCEYIELI